MPRTDRVPRFGWAILAAVLLGYVLAEVGYNIYLVEVVAAPRLVAEDIEQLARIGKLLAGFGLALFTLRFAVWRLISGGAMLVAFVFLGLWGGYYAGLVELFDAVLDRVPTSLQRQSFDLLTLREAVFRGDLPSSSLSPQDRPRGVPHKLHAVNLPLQLVDARRVDRVLERVDGWRRDQANKRAEALARTRMAEAWAVYGAAQGGALPADTILCQAELPVGFISVAAGSLPGHLGRTEFEDNYMALVQPCLIAQLLPMMSTGDFKSATAAIFLPPMSMTLSLLSIAMNFAAALGVIIVGLSSTRPAMRLIGGALPILAIAALLALSARSPFLEGSLPFRLHAELPERLGPIGWLWAHAINAQGIVLEIGADLITTH